MIKGLISPVLTPFNPDLSIAKDLFVAFAQKLLTSGGCAGLAPFGTTGEALSLGIDERMDALDALIAAGVDPAVMIPGTGLTNFVDTARLTRHVMDHGCHGAMILPAFYIKGVSDEGLYAYYAKLIETVDHPSLKIYLYHIPQVTGVGLSPELVGRLHRDFPDIVVGIKDSSGDWENTAALLDIKSMITYPGAELPIIEAIRLGAPGCISATSNVNGRAIAEVIALCHAGEWDAAEKAHEKVRAVRMLFQEYAPIPAQKALLARATGDSRWNTLRPPLMAMDEAGVIALETALKEQFDFAA